MTAVLAPTQAASWIVLGNQLKGGELQTNREFAAGIDVGREMFFHCMRAEFGMGFSSLTASLFRRKSPWARLDQR